MWFGTLGKNVQVTQAVTDLPWLSSAQGSFRGDPEQMTHLLLITTFALVVMITAYSTYDM